MPFDPPFIDITSHAGEAVWDELPDGTWRRRVTRKAFDRGAPSVHFYVMQNTRPFVAMMERLQREA
jgi:hypothetical protein